MRHLVHAALALSLLACGGGDPCDKEGEARCKGNAVEVCDGSSFEESESCGGGEACVESDGSASCLDEVGEFDACTGKACAGSLSCREVEEFGADAVCVRPCDPTATDPCGGDACVQSSTLETDGYCSAAPPAPELEACFGVDRGNCDAGLTCENLPLAGSRCVETCSLLAATPCGTGEYCQPTSAGTNGVCWTVADADEPCFPIIAPPEACSDTQDTCMLTGHGQLASECKELCPATEVWTGQASCSSSAEQCLAGVAPDVEGGSSPVTCTTPGVRGSCSAGYTCTQIFDGEQTRNRCLRPGGVCGTPAPILYDLSPTAVDALTPDDLCGAPGAAQYCPNAGDGAPLIECTPLPIGLPLTDGTDRVTCTSGDLESEARCALYARACINFTDGAACGFLYHVCVPFAESPDGGTSVTCPTGTAASAAHDVAFVFEDGGVYPASTDACTGNGDCNGGAGFTCNTTLFTQGFCARPRKVCLTTN